ncbi:MAG: type II toxin-antitoxin system prevent-host-death family antitoxin [Patescibacteria group bacterium]
MNITVSAMDARKRFGEILNSAFYRGISTVIERKGKPIAKIVPVLDDRVTPGKSLLAYAGMWKDDGDIRAMKKAIAHIRRSPARVVKPL